MNVTGQQIGICNALVVAYFKVLNWHLSKRLKKRRKAVKMVARKNFELGTERYQYR